MDNFAVRNIVVNVLAIERAIYYCYWILRHWDRVVARFKVWDRRAQIALLADSFFVGCFISPRITMLFESEWRNFLVNILFFLGLWLLIRNFMLNWLDDWVPERFGQAKGRQQ